MAATKDGRRGGATLWKSFDGVIDHGGTSAQTCFRNPLDTFEGCPQEIADLRCDFIRTFPADGTPDMDNIAYWNVRELSSAQPGFQPAGTPRTAQAFIEP